MLEQTLYEFAPMFAEKQLDTSVQVPADLYFLCDPDKLQRVLDNLLRNAVNYSFPESVIKIRLYVDMGILTLIVENEGSTIPPEKLERIFEQFFRLDSSRASRNGGAGLGLAIAKEIVELHGGKISAESHDSHVIFSGGSPVFIRKSLEFCVRKRGFLFRNPRKHSIAFWYSKSVPGQSASIFRHAF